MSSVKFFTREPVRADSCQTNCRSTNEPKRWYSRSTGNAPSPQDHSLIHASTTSIKAAADRCRRQTKVAYHITKRRPNKEWNT